MVLAHGCCWSHVTDKSWQESFSAVEWSCVIETAYLLRKASGRKTVFGEKLKKKAMIGLVLLTVGTVAMALI